MERTLENLEAINEQLSIRNEELEKEKLELLNDYDELDRKAQRLSNEVAEQAKQLASMRCA